MISYHRKLHSHRAITQQLPLSLHQLSLWEVGAGLEECGIGFGGVSNTIDAWLPFCPQFLPTPFVNSKAKGTHISLYIYLKCSFGQSLF